MRETYEEWAERMRRKGIPLGDPGEPEEPEESVPRTRTDVVCDAIVAAASAGLFVLEIGRDAFGLPRSPEIRMLGAGLVVALVGASGWRPAGRMWRRVTGWG